MKHTIALWLLALSGCALIYDFDYKGRALMSIGGAGAGGAESEAGDTNIGAVVSWGSSAAGIPGGAGGGSPTSASAGGGIGGASSTSAVSSSASNTASSSQASSSSGFSCALPPAQGCDCWVDPPAQWLKACAQLTICQYTCPFCHPGPPWPDCIGAGTIPGTQTWVACCGAH